MYASCLHELGWAMWPAVGLLQMLCRRVESTGGAGADAKAVQSIFPHVSEAISPFQARQHCLDNGDDGNPGE